MNTVKDARSALSEDLPLISSALESRTRLFTTAINNRHFDPDLPPWSYSTGKPFDVPEISDWTNACKEFIAKHPDFQCKITDISSSVNPSGNFVEVYVNFVQSGECEGVKKKGVCKYVWVWSEKEGDWRVGQVKGIFGLDAGPCP